jgi:hypothetical protein
MSWNVTSLADCNERLLAIECEAATTSNDWPTFWRQYRVEVRQICEAERRSFSHARDGLLRTWRRMESPRS